MTKTCIGIISYLPDDPELRDIRKYKLLQLLYQCDVIFNIPIIVVAQNWDFEINSGNVKTYNYKNKLGITGARKELRKIFLDSNFDYLIMLDDDSELYGDRLSGMDYLDQIDQHQDMYGIFHKNLLKLFAISKFIFNKVDYYNGEAENGDFFEDMLFIKTLEKLYPEREFKFKRTALIEKSDSAHDKYSTWYHGQFDKKAIGDRTRNILSNIKSNNEDINIFYFDRLNVVGGVESFFYYMAKEFHNRYNLVFYYGPNSDPDQVERLKQYCECYQYNKGTKLKCKRLFVQYNYDQIIQNTEADEYIEVIHADYTDIPFHIIHPKITKYIAVSDLASKAFTSRTGLPCETYYIPVKIDNCNIPKSLNLISATRLKDKQKGKKRIEALAKRLTERNIPFIWTIFTDDKNEINNPFVIYVKPTLNILPYIKASDFLVQLSDRESYCLADVESWNVGVPVITTDLPILKETGATKTNSIILKKDLSNIDDVIDVMISKKFNFKYNTKQSDWAKIFENE